MKFLKKAFGRRPARPLTRNTGQNRMNRAMPGEAAAIASVRLGCMSL